MNPDIVIAGSMNDKETGELLEFLIFRDNVYHIQNVVDDVLFKMSTDASRGAQNCLAMLQRKYNNVKTGSLFGG